MTNDTSIRYARDNRDRFLADLVELLSIPSISALPEHRPDMERAAVWLQDRLAGLGFDAGIVRGDGHPLVHAGWLGASGAPTILVYGHYDVQPVDPIDQWHSPPFQPAFRNGNIYGRGTSDDKGQLMVSLAAAESLLRTTGSLPVNLKFLIEGEEESSGDAVGKYLQHESERLTADIAQIADSAMFAPGVPSIDTGLRGLVYTEIHARGARTDLHSGKYGGVAPNPLNALAYVISRLKDERGHILIPGFYDQVVPPDSHIVDSWKLLPFDPEQMRESAIGSSQLVGEEEYSPLERTWSRPTLDVHGIAGGFTGEGSKTVIPAEATAKISMRIVPNQTSSDIFDRYQRYVQTLSPAGIQLDVRLLGSGEAVLVPADSPYVNAARSALEETFGRAPVLIRSGGSIPVVAEIKDTLGIDTVLMGWGLPDDNLHAPNEKLSLQNFSDGVEATMRFWSAVQANGVTSR